MSYEFGGCFYGNTSALLDAIAETFITANGAWKRDMILTDPLFTDRTDAQLARECVKEWGMDQPQSDPDTDEETDQTWLEERDITEAEIATAIGDYRQRLRDEAAAESDDEESA
jgi:hypothetical protein